MLKLQVSVVLPYYLRLTNGSYQTSLADDAVEIVSPILMEGSAERSVVRARFEADDRTGVEGMQQRRWQCADQLLRRINRLLRWYRSVSRQAEITELTRAQVSPFQFDAIGAVPSLEWKAPLEFVAGGPESAELTMEQTTHAVRVGLASGKDPDVADLFLLDAERACRQGRFRESVLFCWSTIDGVFNRRFNALADVALAGEWSDARNFFRGLDFGLRNKMSVGMRFVANRSLYAEPGDFWKTMAESYGKRNKIIHDGHSATEDDAIQAIDVARRVVQIMSEV